MFRYGNGEREVSKRVIDMPVCMATRRGTIRAAIVTGDAPLLLSRPALKALDAKVDFGKDSLQLFGQSQAGPVDVPLSCNAAGQHVISVVDFPEASSEAHCMASVDEHPPIGSESMHS